MLIAQAEAEKIRRIGEAEASVIEAIGKAEAEKMKLKAEAYQQYGDAAKMALVLDALPQVRAGAGWRGKGAGTAFPGASPWGQHFSKLLSCPQIAAKVSAPLAKVDEIVILSGDNNKLTSDVTRLLAEIPASVHALTGVDLSKVKGSVGEGEN